MSGIINQVGAKSGIISGGGSASAGTVTLSGTTGLVYEEGDWTPIISDTSNNATGYDVNEGYYTKIGRVCYLTGRITTNNLGSVSGYIVLGGFPFTVNNSNKARSGLTIVGHDFNLSASEGPVIGGDCETDTTFAYLRRWDSSGGSTQMTGAEWSADGGAYFSIFYIVA